MSRAVMSKAGGVATLALLLAACGGVPAPVGSHVGSQSSPHNLEADRGALKVAALPSGSLACFYEDINYQGASLCASSNQTWIGGTWNDRVSSVQIAPGATLQLFSDINLSGRSLTLTANTPTLVSLNFNDLTSSYKLSGSACAAQTWQPNTSYQLGDVVRYPSNNQYYKVVNVIASGTDKTDPTISTWYWQPTTCSVNPPPPPPPPSGKLLGTYYATFAGAVPRLKDIDPNYNLVYLFSATNAGGEPVGTLKFNPPPDGNGAWTNWKSDLQYARSVQKRLMILSVGGAGNAIKFTDRTVSTTFVNSVDKLYNDWGGFDGIDFNTFEGDAAPNTPEMIWAAQELKRRHPGFIVSAPPAPWNKVDQQFCKDMLSAGALDFCAPQYYDGPQLSDPSYLLTNIKIWMDLLGPDHVVVGFGINNELNNYWKIGSAVDAFRQLKAQYPGVKGAFDWRLDWDAAQNYPFAQQFAPLVAN